MKQASRLAWLIALMAATVNLSPSPVSAQIISGSARVIDGDSLEVEGQRIRLFGIDAPEMTQACERSGDEWACGKASAEHLRELIGTRAVTCQSNEVDVYGRLLAVCSISEVELNRAMVAGGWATAFRRYSTDYVAEEIQARGARRGLWGSNFMVPEDYRRTEDAAKSEDDARQAAPVASPKPMPSCIIKGNRSRRGDSIYHLPGMPHYDETRAEEMFCSEAEARAAGYRRSRAGR